MIDEGELPDGRQALYINLSNTFSTDLPYIYVQLSLYSSKAQPITVRALHDSGCSQTMISKAAYLRIPGSNINNIEPTSKFKIAAFDGRITPPLGMVKLDLSFKSEQGTTITIPRIVLVHEFTTHDFMLGRDFTGSDHKLYETNTHIYLTDQYNGIHKDIQGQKTTKDTKSTYKIPIIQASTNNLPINSISSVHLPPYSMGTVQCKIYNHHKHYDLLKHRQYPQTPIIVDKISQPLLKVPDAIYYLESNNTIAIPFYNNSADDYFIPVNTRMGHVKVQPADSLSTWQIEEMDETIIQSNNVQFIHDNDILTEEEKDKEFEIFKELGRHTIPMTSYVESKPSITEFQYKENTHKEETEQEFLNKFKLEHLPTKAKD
jgi:hypothetical protein